LNRRMPNGTYGGVGGDGDNSALYPIVAAKAKGLGVGPYLLM
jgi:hypothetical protein